ncbi:hypothetical protein OH77DRAFT_1401301, partial [Trametes cingulata]
QLYRSRRFILLDVPQLSQHAVLFDRMSAVNMSGDETDGPEVQHPPVYRIIIAEWQSLELRTFLWILDLWYLEHWAHPPNARRTGGNPPRTRVANQHCRTVRGVAAVGLWRNCYNQEWLNAVPAWQRDMLEIIDEDYDFGLAAYTG